VRAQLQLAGELQDLGMRNTRRVSALLDAPEDEAGQQLVLQTTRRLIAISPERETLAGLVKAAVEVVDRAVKFRTKGTQCGFPAAAQECGLQVITAENTARKQ
jgi:hypothetical protein